jgi:hypothetical protein
MNKRGSALDVILLTAFLFSFGIGFFIINFMVNTTVDKMVLNPQINSSVASVNALNGIENNVTNRLDYVVFGILIGMILALIVTGWLIGGNPLFMVFYFLIVVVAVAGAAILSNIWETMTQRPEFIPTLANFPITNHILLYFPYYIAIVGVIGLTVMFAKPYISGQGVDFTGNGGHL